MPTVDRSLTSNRWLVSCDRCQVEKTCAGCGINLSQSIKNWICTLVIVVKRIKQSFKTDPCKNKWIFQLKSDGHMNISDAQCLHNSCIIWQQTLQQMSVFFRRYWNVWRDARGIIGNYRSLPGSQVVEQCSHVWVPGSGEQHVLVKRCRARLMPKTWQHRKETLPLIFWFPSRAKTATWPSFSCWYTL